MMDLRPVLVVRLAEVPQAALAACLEGCQGHGGADVAVVLSDAQRDMIIRALRAAGVRRVPEPPAHAIRNYEFGG